MHLLLLPGLDGTGALFAPFLSALDRAFEARVVSYPTTNVMPPEIELPRQPFAIVAESFSGPIALRIAARKPANLFAIVLVATFIDSPMRWMPAWLVRPQLLAPLARSRLLIRHQLLDASASDELVDLVRAAIMRVRPEVLAGRVRSILTLDAADALQACALPMLYLQATRDRVVPSRAVRVMARYRPDLRVERIEGPHLLLQCNPAGAARVIEQFLVETRKKIDPSAPDC
jgi:pimeloyl-ACP methyl ester carboxylesterase